MNWFGHDQATVISVLSPLGLVLIGEWSLRAGIYAMIGLLLVHQIVLWIRMLQNHNLGEPFAINGMALLVGFLTLYGLSMGG